MKSELKSKTVVLLVNLGTPNQPTEEQEGAAESTRSRTASGSAAFVDALLGAAGGFGVHVMS